ADGFPTQFDHWILGSSTDELPGLDARAGHGVPVHRRGDAEGAGLGDRLAQKVDQRMTDARVRNAAGRQKKLHVASVSFSAEKTPAVSENHRGAAWPKPPTDPLGDYGSDPWASRAAVPLTREDRVDRSLCDLT